MIAGITHLAMEADLDQGIAWGKSWGLGLSFRDDIELPTSFENVEKDHHTLPLALLSGAPGIRLEVVHHRRSSGVGSAYKGVFRCAPPARTPVDRPRIGELLTRSGTAREPVCVALGASQGETWFDAASSGGGIAGVLCSAYDIQAETEFWSRFASVRWAGTEPDAAWGDVPSPVAKTRCRILLASTGPAPAHAMNDAGFPSIGVFSTSIDDDCARAVRAGAYLRAEPITTTVGGQKLRMALIGSPAGAPVELLSVIKP